MENNKKQWQKRVDLTQFIYLCLVSNFDKSEINKEALVYSFDANQLKVIEYFANNKNDITKSVSSHLGENWTWERIPLVTQAIFYETVSEVKSTELPKAIAIDQALVTAKKYGQIAEAKFINAVLDKIL